MSNFNNNKPAITTDSNTNSGIVVRLTDGSTRHVPEARLKNKQAAPKAGDCFLAVVAEKTKKGAIAYPGLTPDIFPEFFRNKYNTLYLQKNKEVPVTPGDVVVCVADQVADHKFGPQVWATPMMVIPADALDQPGFIEMLALSGMFPNISCRKKLTEELPRWDWQGLTANVKLAGDAPRADIAKAVVNRIINRTIGIQTVLKGITEVAPIEETVDEDLVGLHADGRLVAGADVDGSVFCAHGYGNGPSRAEQQAADAIRPPKGPNKGDSHANRRHKVTGKGKKPTDTGKGDKGKKAKKDK